MSSTHIPVTIDNFTRAETDTYFARHGKDAGGLGRFHHLMHPVQVDYQPVVRMNRDTLYSGGVFDLTEPATIVLPDSGGRFMSMIVINQDHYIKFVTYDPGEHTLTRDAMGTRYVEVVCRTFVDPDDPTDVKAANALQTNIQIKQKSPGVLELPQWDQESLDACRAAVMKLVPFLADSGRTFGDVDGVEPVRHLIGTARGWGGNREEDAHYVLVTPEQNDGKTPYVLKLKDVPLDGFWSLSIYDAKGYFAKNDYGAYSLNNVTAKPDVDGSYTIHFGGDPKAVNFLYIMPGWNYTVRLYRPRKEILDGSWKFPEALPEK
jgi:hypothetical protein